MALAGYPTEVKATGAAVAMTDEAMSLVSGKTYRVTNTAKQLVDPAVAITVKDNAIAVDPANFTFDYLFGEVTFVASYTPTTPITVSGSYLPTYTVGQGRAVEIRASQDLGDVSVFGTGAKLKQGLLAECSVELERLLLPLDDIDTVTGGTQSLHSWMTAGTPKVLDILPTAGARFRAAVLFSGYSVKATVAGVVEVQVSAQSAAQGGTRAFGWGT